MFPSEGKASLKNPVTPPGIDSGTVRLVAKRLNHYATPGPQIFNIDYQYINVVIDWINYCIIAKHNEMAPIKWYIALYKISILHIAGEQQVS